VFGYLSNIVTVYDIVTPCNDARQVAFINSDVCMLVQTQSRTKQVAWPAGAADTVYPHPREENNSIGFFGWPWQLMRLGQTHHVTLRPGHSAFR